jgi:hypothetical protein
LPGSRNCIVSYSVRSDTGRNFRAGLTVTNLTSTPVEDWTLRFVMPGDQTVSAIGKLTLDQQEHDVAVRSTTAIRANSTAVMDVKGDYRRDNAVPVAFSLMGQTCDVFVSGRPGEPSRPVQQLVGGGTRLGPVPPAGVVLPGLSASPGGVITPVPTSATGSTIPTATSDPTDEPKGPAPDPQQHTTDPTATVDVPPDLPTTDPTTTEPESVPEMTEATTDPTPTDDGGLLGDLLGGIG